MDDDDDGDLPGAGMFTRAARGRGYSDEEEDTDAQRHSARDDDGDEPSQEVQKLCEVLGIDPESEPWLIGVVKDAISIYEDLPEHWQAYEYEGTLWCVADRSGFARPQPLKERGVPQVFEHKDGRIHGRASMRREMLPNDPRCEVEDAVHCDAHAVQVAHASPRQGRAAPHRAISVRVGVGERTAIA